MRQRGRRRGCGDARPNGNDGKLLRTDPKDLIESALRRARDILSADKFDQVNIDYDYDDAQLEVEVNPYLVTHALTNILTNAVRYALSQDQSTPHETSPYVG